MRRIALILVALVALPILVAAESDDDGGDYKVRAIFDDAAFLAKDEQVKIAGAGVGTIDSVELTDDEKAAVTFTVTESAFTPFHADAHCTIRAEGLLAVKFVECDPGTAEAPELASIESGPGSGAKSMPVEQTTTPVDLDLVLDTYREPAGQQLSLMLSELGAGVAGRGKELNQVIHRSVPALQQTDQLFKILASQNRALAQFASDADSVNTALASKRAELADFMTAAAGTTQATAARSDEISASIRRLPGFLRELRFAANDLADLANEGTPVLTNLGISGADLGRAVGKLEPVARKGIPAVNALGDYANHAGPDLQRTAPLIEAANALATPLKPLAIDLGDFSKSLKKKEARQRFLELLYNATSSTNAFDADGHYSRVEVLSSACSEYTPKGYMACDAQWGGQDDVNPPIANAATATPKVAAPKSVNQAGGTATALLDYLIGGGQ